MAHHVLLRTGPTVVLLAVVPALLAPGATAVHTLVSSAVATAAPPSGTTTAADGFEGLISAAAQLILAAAVGWLSLALAACVVAESGRLGERLAGRAAAALTPRRARLLVRLACGVAVAAPVGMLPAHAGEAGESSCDAAACAPPLCRLPIPDRPDASGQLSVQPMPTEGHAVTVHPGDSLWAIAAAQLPPGIDDAGIAAAWPVWFAANRHVIGDNPHLIHPGTSLTVPARFRTAP